MPGQDPRSPRVCGHGARAVGQARDTLGPSTPGVSPCPRGIRVVRAFVDTDILVRHLTGDPPELVARATRFLAEADQLLLTDLALAEMVYVLESFYEVQRERVAELTRSVVAFPAVLSVDDALLLRTIELYEVERLDFADAYLVASAEATGLGVVASFDQRIERAPSMRRIEP